MKHKILFLGTSDFAVPILEKLNKDHKIVAVITQPDKPVGRKQVLTPPPVKAKAEALGLKVLQPKLAAEIPLLVKEPFDFLITAAYGQYLPDPVLKLASKDAFNVHPSLLPKYRGATPIRSAILNGDTKMGVSIMRMVKAMDAGPVFAQEKMLIPSDIFYSELRMQCSGLGAKLISEVLSNYDSLTPNEQDHENASNCHKISKEDGQIDWANSSATQLYNKLRAFFPWPGAFTGWHDQKLSLIDFSPHPDKISSHSPGAVYEEDKVIFVQTKEGSIEIKELQLAGKNPTDIKSFLNGHQAFIGSTLK